MNSRILANNLVLLSTLFGLWGCAGNEDPFQQKRQEVMGFVSLDGEPLEKGRIYFVPIEDTPGPKTSVEIRNGSFLIEREYGPVAGLHRVEIESTETGGYAMDDEDALEKLKEEGVEKIDVTVVPEKYGANSPLRAEVKEDGRNEFEFELES